MKQITIDDIHKIVGALYLENAMLREALAKTQIVKVDASKTDNVEPGSKDQQGPVAIK